MPLTATKKEHAYRLIRRAIIRGELKPGEILNMDELSTRFGVGKTPVREALIVLASERLVEPLPRTGYVITPITVRDVLETFHLRVVLEVEAISLAVDRITEEDLRALERNNAEEMEIAGLDDKEEAYERAYQLNREFHLIIARASGHLRLVRLVEQFLDEMERMLTVDPYLADSRQHLEIVRALRRRDRAEAQETMRRHLDSTKSRIIDRF